MTSSAPYAELHLHTAYSFLDGASLPEEIVTRAAELGYRSLAITDHDGLYGAMEFVRAAHAVGITPITGAELTLNDGSHLTLLAETPVGYVNLCRLITAAHGGFTGQRRGDPSHIPDHPIPSISLDLLSTHAEGLILLTGCRQGALARLVDAGNLPAAETLLQHYVEWFGPHSVVVELQQNLVFGDTGRIAALVALAERGGVRYAATGNVHYHRPERHPLQDVLVAIRHRTTLDGAHRQRRANAEFFLRSPREMEDLFARYPAALRTTREIAERCTGFDLVRDLAYCFPDYATGSGQTPDEHLAALCHERLLTHYPTNSDAAISRLNEELRLIKQHGLAGFFLLYRDLIELGREVAEEIRGAGTARAAGNLPPGRGRGSSVSSIVCYLIGLSAVDPLAHGLFLGRFLNEEISSIPDIDIDFPREIRERLIERVYEKYPDRAALVCAFSTYRLRSAVRDVGKALGLPLTDLDRIAKLSEPRSARDLEQELSRIPEYAIRKDVAPWRHLIDLAEQLAGFPRHVTQHSGGMIISSIPLSDLVPMQPTAMPGRFLCQWDKDSCDDARFVKIDFLALGMLSLVEECLELIATTHPQQTPIDLGRIDFADKRVYGMIGKGDTIGTFQIESRAQIQTLLRTQPRSLADLVVQVAIIRPGPIIGGAVSPYVMRRRQADFQPTYDHPRLEPVLRETLGVILYQEQVIAVAMAMAGFTAGQADQLRRAMTRKRSHEAMIRLRDQFLEGARAREDVPEKTARRVFDKLLGFAEYGFPKSHAAAFAVLAYQSAWLKHYYPAEFACALLNNQPMGFYPPHVLVNDAKRHGVRIFPPDVNQSLVRCSIEGNAIRIGLGSIADLGDDAANRIVLERETNGPYRSLADLVRRQALRLEAAENLVAVGAASDSFGLGRREALWQLGLFLPNRAVGGKRTRKTPGLQLSLPLPVEQDMVTLPAMGPSEQMATDYETLGLSPRYHPMALLRPRLPASIASSVDLTTLADGMLIQIAGLIVCRQRPGTAKGITFLLMEDEHGLVNIIVYPSLYEAHRHVVRAEPFLLITGRLQRRDGIINLLAEQIVPLTIAHADDAPIAPAPTGDWSPLPDTVAGEPAPGSNRVEINFRPITPASHNYR